MSSSLLLFVHNNGTFQKYCRFDQRNFALAANAVDDAHQIHLKKGISTFFSVCL